MGQAKGQRKALSNVCKISIPSHYTCGILFAKIPARLIMIMLVETEHNTGGVHPLSFSQTSHRLPTICLSLEKTTTFARWKMSLPKRQRFSLQYRSLIESPCWMDVGRVWDELSLLNYPLGHNLFLSPNFLCFRNSRCWLKNPGKMMLSP